MEKENLDNNQNFAPHNPFESINDELLIRIAKKLFINYLINTQTNNPLNEINTNDLNLLTLLQNDNCNIIGEQESELTDY